MFSKNFLFISFCFLFLSAAGKELRVGRHAPFTTIRSALAAAEARDIILAEGGVYKEGNLVIDKPIALCGENNPVLDGENKVEVLTVISDSVTIEGITIQNSGKSDLKELAGIRLENANHCRIRNNRIWMNFFGIYLANSSYCEISGNEIKSNATTEGSSGNGIHLWNCKNNIIEGNYISGNRDGIYFEFVINSSISNNISEKNLRYGLHFMFSDHDTYRNNTFRYNGSGVAVMYTKHIEMTDNVFEHNWGGAAYGLLLKEITDSRIYRNTFIRNTTGAYLEGTSRCRIYQNTFSNNGWAMKILGNCLNDTVQHNNFIANSFDISTNTSSDLNYFNQNYWDKYEGYDLNKDQKGDVPFHPVSLYSKMVEQVPHSIMLLHSLMINILERTEKIIPSVTPENFRDDTPLMKPHHAESGKNI